MRHFDGLPLDVVDLWFDRTCVRRRSVLLVVRILRFARNATHRAVGQQYRYRRAMHRPIDERAIMFSLARLQAALTIVYTYNACRTSGRLEEKGAIEERNWGQTQQGQVVYIHVNVELYGTLKVWFAGHTLVPSLHDVTTDAQLVLFSNLTGVCMG